MATRVVAIGQYQRTEPMELLGKVDLTEKLGLSIGVLDVNVVNVFGQFCSVGLFGKKN